MGPVVEEPGDKLQRGLTMLEPGQRWNLVPKRLDHTGRLFSPGIRSGIRPGSEYHLTEYFGPVLGVMAAETLEEAIEYVNAVPYGLTSGIHSLDPDEIAQWAEHVAAGNLYINRGITGAIVRRQPFGGWKRSSIGPGTKVGGPNYLLGLTDWLDAPDTVPQAHDAEAARFVERVATFLEDDETTWLARAVAHDADAVSTYTGQRDVTDLEVEINLLRYRPVPVHVRLTDASSMGLAQLLRVASAGIRVQTTTATGQGTGVLPTNVVSLPLDAPRDIASVFAGTNMKIVFEDPATWLQRAVNLAEHDPADGSGRIRMIGAAEVDDTMNAIAHRPEIAMYRQPVTSAGRLEMLPFIREQAVTMTAHRFGTINDLPQRALGDIQFG